MKIIKLVILVILFGMIFSSAQCGPDCGDFSGMSINQMNEWQTQQIGLIMQALSSDNPNSELSKYKETHPFVNDNSNSGGNNKSSSYNDENVGTEQHCYTWFEYITVPTYGYGVAKTVKIPHKVCHY